MTIETKLAELGLVLPKPASAVASYVPFVISGSQVQLAGQLPFDAQGSLILGRLGAELTVEQGFDAAQACGLMLVAQLAAALDNDFDRLVRVVKLGVFVNSTSEFVEQPKVANGASNLFVSLFGDRGRHARSAVGVPVLPLGVAVEVDAIVEITS